MKKEKYFSVKESEALLSLGNNDLILDIARNSKKKINKSNILEILQKAYSLDFTSTDLNKLLRNNWIKRCYNNLIIEEEFILDINRIKRIINPNNNEIVYFFHDGKWKRGFYKLKEDVVKTKDNVFSVKNKKIAKLYRIPNNKRKAILPKKVFQYRGI